MAVTTSFDPITGLLTIFGDNNSNRIRFSQGSYDSINNSIRLSVSGDAKAYHVYNLGAFTGVKKIIVYGEDGDDTIVSQIKNVSIEAYGRNGDDAIGTGFLADTLDGGAGNDSFKVSGHIAEYDTIIGGDGYDESVNQQDPNSRVHYNNHFPSQSVEVLRSCYIPRGTSIDGNPEDNIFDFSQTTLDNIGGIHTWDIRLGGGNDIIKTSPNVINHYYSNPVDYLWYDGDGLSQGLGTNDVIDITVTTSQWNVMTQASKDALYSYLANPAIYQGSNTFKFKSIESGVEFQASNFEVGKITILPDSVNNASSQINLHNLVDDDLLYGQASNDYLNGETGDDTLYGRAGNDFLNGGAGDDSLYGDRGNDTVYGGVGDDRLTGYGGNQEFDILIGDGGQDVFVLGKARVHYNETGNIEYYAILVDFSSQDDKIQVKGTTSNYSLRQDLNWRGTSTLDTSIYFGSELIGVVQDNTNVLLNRDFTFV